MSTATVYREFLSAPNSSLLAANATLNYITTTTAYNGATDIIKHFGTMRNQVKKKKEDVLELIDGSQTIAVEIDTTLEFLTSGGPYLPGLDDNFLSDRTVYLPIMHVVTFNGQGKIVQIRQSWDQGSLLKQLDVIGRTGRNWPIRDSREQLRLISTCLKAAGKVEPAPADAAETINRSRGNSTNALRDPHASLSLFGHREEAEQATSAAVVSPYAGGSRPRQRSFAEILGDEADQTPASPSAGRERAESPSKAVPPKIGSSKNYQPIRLFEAEELAEAQSLSPEKTMSPKVGAGKNYQPIRLFDGTEYAEGHTPEQSPDKFYRPNPRKYNHFDFADGSDPQDAPKPGFKYEDRQKGKHDTTWGFEDFTTPQKAAPGKQLKHQDRHWDNEDTEETPVQGKGRRDAETHFEFRDDGIPQGERLARHPRGAMHNTGLHLYENNLYSEDGTAAPGDPDARALGTITNLKDRKKDFDHHWDMTDNPPPASAGPARAPVPEDRMKAVKMMDPNWTAYDESPTSQKENNPAGGKEPKNGGIHIAGDGMGGKKGANRDWIFAADGQEQTPRAVPGKKPNAAAAASQGLWDF